MHYGRRKFCKGTRELLTVLERREARLLPPPDPVQSDHREFAQTPLPRADQQRRAPLQSMNYMRYTCRCAKNGAKPIGGRRRRGCFW
jgi:hypothetical protein